jgi:hypothetical protein
MPENHLFEYAVIRIVPRVEREEFLNAGVILYCRDQHFLQVKFTLDEQRLQNFCPLLDIAELKEHLISMESICKGREEAGPIGRLDMASRFRWLTAKRSTIVQTSPIHPGLCKNAADMLTRLHTQLVLL